jgi:SSS family solute:Na+ symporter
MGSALSAVFTRDVYARLIAPDRDDEHYVKVGRYATVAILSLGFAYIPFIRSKATMLEAFRTLIPVFVTPLFTTYLIGIWTRFPRRAGIGGLALGGLYGIVAFYDRETQDLPWLPNWFTGSAEAFSWSIVWTLLGATAVTLLGADRKSADQTAAPGSPTNRGWLARSSEELPPIREHPFRTAPPLWLHPAGFALALILASAYIIFVVFW